jgi:predicted DCC family thiol-disulfide oxidoreductase YuxK
MHLVLYDGVCGLCDRTVQFILRNDRRDRFQFATLQGATGAEAARKHGFDPTELSSFILVLDYETPSERAMRKGKAALRVLWELGGAWKLIGWLCVLPKWIVDPVYMLIARNRYRVFGQLEACRIPSPAERAKFVD